MSITVTRVTDLVEGLIADRGFDLEDVSVSAEDAIVLVVDRAGGSSLDLLGELTRALTETLDAEPPLADTDYTLEVTSRGIDRPLTLERHWRYALGRKVAVDRVVDAAPAEQLIGRVGQLQDGRVDIVQNLRGRLKVEQIELDSVTNAVVEVDFSSPSVAELRLCGMDDTAIEARRTPKN